MVLMTRFCNIVFSDPEMLPMYLISGIYYSEGTIECDGIVYHYIKFTNRNYFHCFRQVATFFSLHLVGKNQI